MNASLAILLDLKTSLSVPIADAGAWPQCDTLLNVQVYGDAEHYVHAAASCDVVGEPTLLDRPSPATVEHFDGYAVFKPTDPSRVPIRILMTKAPHELPHRLLISVGPLTVDRDTLTCTAVAFAELIPPAYRALSNVINLYDTPWHPRPSSALGLSCTVSPRSLDEDVVRSVCQRYDIPCSSLLYKGTALTGLEDIANLPMSAVGTSSAPVTPK
ncbi:hypothetical protein OH76DRAFT_1422330 [Lentinus brumalis]|uniref:Uncharacterized protein n=1 Tax=Lentinus brumalis TaxID=2498619 RepID=A0A371CR56_9APHY|nr:hypothetical protein OH76DRAFT_1422330 [Polyporus brumalis]